MTKTVFIYSLNDPITGMPRYVGQTPDPKRRLREHLSRKRTYHCARWIKSLRSQNLLPVMEIIDQSPSADADFWEIEYIRLYRALFPGLTNISPGGGSSLGRVPSSETRSKMSIAMRGEKNPFFGKTHSLESRAAMSAAHRGKPVSPETRLKKSVATKGKKRGPFSAEHRANISAARKGYVPSLEARANQSAAQLGKKRGPYKKKGAGAL